MIKIVEKVDFERYLCQICYKKYSNVNDAIDCETRHKCPHTKTKYQFYRNAYPFDIYKTCDQCNLVIETVEFNGEIPQELMKIIFDFLNTSKKEN